MGKYLMPFNAVILRYGSRDLLLLSKKLMAKNKAKQLLGYYF